MVRDAHNQAFLLPVTMIRVHDAIRQSRQKSLNGRTLKKKRGESFAGFESINANFIYCPNQLFDVCLPNESRGAFRIVCYLLKKTLSWLDKNGDPIEQEIQVSYAELIQDAGVSRGAIRAALDSAIASGFISCVKNGSIASSGKKSQSAMFRLAWDNESAYCKSLSGFSGFFAGEGHRSPIPLSFFDYLVPKEPFAVIKVVGTVLRHTVGYENQFGGRRQEAALSYRFIQDFTNLADRSTLSSAIKQAINSGYIRLIQEGSFHPESEKQQAAIYAVRWLREAKFSIRGSKTRPEGKEQFKNQTSSGTKTRPAERFKNQTTERQVINTTKKQQQSDVSSAVAANNLSAYQLLLGEGFDREIAQVLSVMRSSEEIENQIKWLGSRNPEKNRLGLLRKAIEGNWSKPPNPKADAKQETGQKEKQRNLEQQAKEVAVEKQLQEQTTIRKNRMMQWCDLSDDRKSHFHDLTLKQITSPSTRARIRKNHDIHNPAPEVLAVIAASSETLGVIPA